MINIVGKKFLMKNGRMGKVMNKDIRYSEYSDKRLDVYHIRAVGRNKLRNLYSYSALPRFLKSNVIMWFEPDEIKIMYKKIIHYDKNGRELRTTSGAVKSKREKRWY